jgi:hypothetical protein
MLSFACVALEFRFGQEYSATWSSSEGVVVGGVPKEQRPRDGPGKYDAPRLGGIA